MVKSVVGLDHEGQDILDTLKAHENDLIYPRFDESTAWELGALIRKRFIEEKLPSGLNGNIQIRAAGSTPTGDALIYFASVVGTIPPGNATLIKGKAGIVTFSGNSSFLTRLNLRKRKVNLEEFGLDSPRYFLHGGAFPIRVNGSSFPVAIAVVSGMPDMAEDHQIIVDSIEAHLATLTTESQR